MNMQKLVKVAVTSSRVREHQRAIKLRCVENSILAEITWVQPATPMKLDTDQNVVNKPQRILRPQHTKKCSKAEFIKAMLSWVWIKCTNVFKAFQYFWCFTEDQAKQVHIGLA